MTAPSKACHIFQYAIDHGQHGKTVEAFLKSLGYSRRLIISLKKKPEYLTVCGQQVYVTRKLAEGDVLQVILPPDDSSSNIPPSPMELDILFEDDHLMVLNKKAGVPIHPSQGNYGNTLANGIAWYFQEKNLPFVYRAINRLDRDTSGLLILAKHSLSACMLSEMVRQRKVHRTYLAAASGNLGLHFPDGCGTVTAPIGRVSGSTIERQVDWEQGEYACTHWLLLDYVPETDTSLVQLKLDTGRTHQIRIHMRHLGHPLYGDFLYNPDYRLIHRQSLHSWKLEFSHPVTGEDLAFIAPIPEDMEIFLCDTKACPP